MGNKIALLGGSFDPVHLGHLALFNNVFTLTDINKLIIVPTYTSPFKLDNKCASFQDRLEMLELSLLDFKDIYPLSKGCVEISDYECKKGGVSYTSDTIRYFYNDVVDNDRVNFVIGDDLLQDLDKWHDGEYLKKNVRFWCFTRNKIHSFDSSFEVHFVSSPVFNSSSSSIRDGNMSNLSKRVKEYIENAKLYRAWKKSKRTLKTK